MKYVCALVSALRFSLRNCPDFRTQIEPNYTDKKQFAS